MAVAITVVVKFHWEFYICLFRRHVQFYSYQFWDVTHRILIENLLHGQQHIWPQRTNRCFSHGQQIQRHHGHVIVLRQRDTSPTAFLRILEIACSRIYLLRCCRPYIVSHVRMICRRQKQNSTSSSKSLDAHLLHFKHVARF